MGWTSGSSLCEEICDSIKPYITDKDTWEKVSADIVSHFVKWDADGFDFYTGSPYWNYLKIYKPDDYLECCKYRIEDGDNVEKITEELKTYKYRGFNVLLRKWLNETIQSKDSTIDYDINFDYENQAERDEDMLWSREWD